VQAPKTVDYVDSIPMTALGKPDKKALRARYAAPPASGTIESDGAVDRQQPVGSAT
jgi:acyl-CoA synthetase (AMP-forming)/AMP-acid ligase II